MIPPKFTWTLLCIFLNLMARGQQHADQAADTGILSATTVKISGRLYTALQKADTFYLLNSRQQVLLRSAEYYNNIQFKDFNRDGYKDLLLTWSCNTPGVLDLFIFMPSTRTFKKIREFDRFPAPERIKGTHYFYSYHHSGCADLNWDSDLFYIHNNKAIALGNIEGRECGNDIVKDGIYIHRIRNGKKSLIRQLPVQRLRQYKDYKWGFIDAYWTKNYKRFF